MIRAMKSVLWDTVICVGQNKIHGEDCRDLIARDKGKLMIELETQKSLAEGFEEIYEISVSIQRFLFPLLF